jgi:hypothetical protein
VVPRGTQPLTALVFRASQRMILETLHDMEIRHAPHVRKFHLLQSFHANDVEPKRHSWQSGIRGDFTARERR